MKLALLVFSALVGGAHSVATRKTASLQTSAVGSTQLYKKCATGDANQNCVCSDESQISYGAGQTYLVVAVTPGTSYACNVGTFGGADPLFGTPKSCYCTCIRVRLLRKRITSNWLTHAPRSRIFPQAAT